MNIRRADKESAKGGIWGDVSVEVGGGEDTNLTKDLPGFGLIKEPHNDPGILALRRKHDFSVAQRDMAAQRAKVPAASQDGKWRRSGASN